MNDLIDHEMIHLLQTCKRLRYPDLSELEGKFVRFGDNPDRKKTLILDMDETMLHAKFLGSKEDEINDDGDFIFTL